jgi:GNAT superfamily N-acetyltransferase
LSGYDVRPLQPEDEPQVLELLTASLAGGPTGERTPQFFRWKHRDNPFGPSPGWVAVAGNRIVGVRLLMRWEFEFGGRVVRAVRMVDTATAPDWQGRGVFKRLTLTALEEVEDVDLVFNTPNSNSLPGYLKMGWSEVGRVPVLIRPVAPLRLARAVVRGAVRQSAVSSVPPPIASSLPRVDDVLSARAPEVDALLGARRRREDALSTRRSPAYLTWRYGAGSGLDYRAVPVEREGRLVGLGVGRLRHRGPLRELTLGEVLHGAEDRAALTQVLRRSARNSAVDHVVTTLPRADRTAAAGAGFVQAPRAGLLLTARPASALPVDTRLPSSWDLRLGELEVF